MWKETYLLVRFKEHAVGDHGKEQQRHTAADSLDSCKAALCWTRDDREPKMVIGELLAHWWAKQMIEGSQIRKTSNRQDPFYHSIIFFYSQPTVAQEHKPKNENATYFIQVFHRQLVGWLKTLASGRSNHWKHSLHLSILLQNQRIHKNTNKRMDTNKSICYHIDIILIAKHILIQSVSGYICSYANIYTANASSQWSFNTWKADTLWSSLPVQKMY